MSTEREFSIPNDTLGIIPLSLSGRLDTPLLVGCCLLTTYTITIWLLRHWDYLPEWAPVPGPIVIDSLKCLHSLLPCGAGFLNLGALAVGLTTNLVLLVKRVLSRRIGGAVKLSAGLIMLSLTALPWFFGDKIDDILVRYAISRYNVAIDGIEKYREDHGEYPASLNVLIPDYLSSVPGIYMKYGEVLKYDANSSWGYVGYGPFTFELFGSHRILHGQTLKYCPVEDSSCEGFRRIDERWVWAYSSAF